MKGGEKREKGNKGEEVAISYLKKNGYKILEKNYENKIGEIDIVVKKDNVIVFIEVKAQKGKVSNSNDGLYPERNVDWRKQRKLIQTAEYYLTQKHYHEETKWQIDVIGVDLNEDTHRAALRHLKNAVCAM